LFRGLSKLCGRARGTGTEFASIILGRGRGTGKSS